MLFRSKNRIIDAKNLLKTEKYEFLDGILLKKTIFIDFPDKMGVFLDQKITHFSHATQIGGTDQIIFKKLRSNFFHTIVFFDQIKLQKTLYNFDVYQILL